MSKTPSIRFEKNKDEWEFIPLVSIANTITTGKLDANAANLYGKYKFFTCSKDDYKTNTYSFDGDAVIVNGNGDLGITKVFSGKFDAYQRTYVLMDFNQNFSYVGKAIPHYLPERIRKEAIGGAMPYIKIDTLNGLEIGIPSMPEQQDIATFLSNIDSLIEEKNKELDKCKKYKVSMLYKMFPKEGESVPAIRFKGFSGDWNKEVLGKLYEIYNGLNKEKSAFGSGSPIINYMDVNKNAVITDDKIMGKVKLSAVEIKNNIVNKEDVLLARTYEVIEEGAFSSAYVGNLDNVVFSGFLLKAAPLKKEKVCAEFIALYVRYAENARKQINKLATKTSRALINGDNLKKMEILIPKKEEQLLIANFFRNLDTMIENQEKEIKTLEYFKATMLSKMFA
ncbi:MAG: restriction endonuclease subunit S [Candidatus Izemoplasmatales bacterium]|nr:restriction endonuclease subunit S [Candidatus Izemoplasmatales bacterium]